MGWIPIEFPTDPFHTAIHDMQAHNPRISKFTPRDRAENLNVLLETIEEKIYIITSQQIII